MTFLSFLALHLQKSCQNSSSLSFSCILLALDVQCNLFDASLLFVTRGVFKREHNWTRKYTRQWHLTIPSGERASLIPSASRAQFFSTAPLDFTCSFKLFSKMLYSTMPEEINYAANYCKNNVSLSCCS